MQYMELSSVFVLLIFTRITSSYSYNDDSNFENDEENQFGSSKELFPEEFITHLTADVIDSLYYTNNSLKNFLFHDQTINLDHLGIQSIDSDAFLNYQDIVSAISLSSNLLSAIPNDLFVPFRSTLTSLNLQRNRLTTLGQTFFLHSLEQLRTLDLSSNHLQRISKQDFIGLKRLETLILRNNQLTKICYACFSRCRTITTLDLSENQISQIDPNAFRSLYRLKTLILANNPIGQRSMTSYLLEPLKNLEYFDLENTQLNDLASHLFIHNERLKSVKLRGNFFQTMPNDTSVVLRKTFCQAKSLVEVDLVSTNLRKLDVCTYYGVSSLRRLYLMNNPLDCTCDLFYLKYGDIYQFLLMDGNGIDREHANIDVYLDRWITRPELRRHLEISHQRGDIHRLPIELSLFARCATPSEFIGKEINNITGMYTRCQHRWRQIDEQCPSYCNVHVNHSINHKIMVGSCAMIQQFHLLLILFFSLICSKYVRH